MSFQPYVRLPRGFTEAAWWRGMPASTKLVALTAIEKASYKAETLRDGTSTVKLSPGQLCMTLRQLADASECTYKQVRSAVEKLTDVGFWTTEKASETQNAKTLFSLCQWDVFIYPDREWRAKERQAKTQAEEPECQKKAGHTRGQTSGHTQGTPLKPAAVEFSVTLKKEAGHTQGHTRGQTPRSAREITHVCTKHKAQSTNDPPAPEAAPSQPASGKSSEEGFVSHPSDGPLPKESEAAAQAGSASPLHITNQQQTLAIRRASALHALQKAAAEVGFVSGSTTGPAAWDGPVLVAAPTAPQPRSPAGGLDAGDFAAMAAAMLGQAGGAS